MKKLLLMFLLLAHIHAITAQTADNTPLPSAPSLTLGVNGLTMQKGVLDVNVILDIIKAKSLEAGKRVALNLLNESGSTLYSFGANVLEAAIVERDEKTRLKIIMRESIKLSLAVGLTTYYINTHNADTLKKICNLFLPKSAAVATVTDITDFDQPNQAGRTNIRRMDDGECFKAFIALLDIASDCINNNKILDEELEIINGTATNSAPANNEYLEIIKDIKPNKNEQNKLSSFTSIHLDMKYKLDSLVDYLSVINYIYENKDFIRVNSDGSTNLSASIDENQICYLLTNISNQLKLKLSNSLSVKDKDPILEIITYVDKINNAYKYGTDVKQKLKLLHILYKEVLPRLQKLSFADPEIATIIDDVNRIVNQQANMLSIMLGGRMNYLFNEHTNLLNLLGNLHNFKNPKSYLAIVNTLTEVLKKVPSERMKSALEFVISFAQDYVRLSVDENDNPALEFNPETIFVKLASLKSKKFSPLQFTFTVGLNTTIFPNAIQYSSTEAPLNNYSYAGEKIGFKVKIFDWRYTHMQNPGQVFKYWRKYYTRTVAPREPFISNLHILGYGTGLLYNLAGTGTARKFNVPMAGLGIGTTIYNGLDFNASIGLPILSNQSFKNLFQYYFVNIGVDIPIADYISELSRRSSEKKSKKALVASQNK